MLDFDWSVVWKYREVLWDGMLTSLKLFAIALAGGIFFGTLLAMARLSRWKALSVPAAGFVNLIRAIPFIMAMGNASFFTNLITGGGIVLFVVIRLISLPEGFIAAARPNWRA